ncbi:ribosomal protein S18-alanine N-acetyltransferase [Enterococcus sp. CSURQ0835]|uniref:ribosomal protein S18-alanine N-acetyltransferase n=1 Tax=Enterococcus sp. CSURQ0835 TaxID=2681394 RepID=UPI00135C5399|nr:ribosomal protein S18-alanine N-acetyltransferase [Enterococcus sp. CSURQ0835]
MELAEELWHVSQQAYPKGSPWKKKQFASDLALGHSHYFCERNDEQLLAFLGIHQVCDEIEITNVATCPACHQQGLASRLLTKLLVHAQQTKATQIFLEVRASNLKAQHLYRKFGFDVLAVRKNYYHEPTEDAWVMNLKVGEKDV